MGNPYSHPQRHPISRRKVKSAVIKTRTESYRRSPLVLHATDLGCLSSQVRVNFMQRCCKFDLTSFRSTSQLLLRPAFAELQMTVAELMGHSISRGHMELAWAPEKKLLAPGAGFYLGPPFTQYHLQVPWFPRALCFLFLWHSGRKECGAGDRES